MNNEPFLSVSFSPDQWYTSLDAEGRIYFYEEDSNESLWALPAVPDVPDVPVVTITEEVVTSGAAPAKSDEKELEEKVFAYFCLLCFFFCLYWIFKHFA